MADYNHTTFKDLRQMIADALGDSKMSFWTSDDIDLCIKETLLTFGALSGFWKGTFFTQTVDKKQIYDIFTDCTDITRIKPSMTFEDVLKWINRDLIENISQANPISKVITIDDIMTLIEGRYNLYQLKTNLVLSQYLLNIQAQNNLYSLADETIDLIRVLYTEDTDPAIIEVLRKEDEVSLSYFDQDSLLDESQPEFYTSVYGMNNELKLYPMPANAAVLQLIAVNALTGFIGIGTPINLPNNLVPYLKWGVLTDIYSKDGLLNNPIMAQYCDQRWQEGVIIGKSYAAILSPKADGIPIFIDSMYMMDLNQNFEYSKDAPNVLGLAGLNIFELENIPDTDVHSVEFVLEHNAPIPNIDEDFIQVELEYIDAIVEYGMHLATLKGGIADLQPTIPAMQDFLQIAIQHNKKLQLRGITLETILGTTKKEEEAQPRIPEEVNG